MSTRGIILTLVAVFLSAMAGGFLADPIMDALR
jgi:hypothetical protein